MKATVITDGNIFKEEKHFIIDEILTEITYKNFTQRMKLFKIYLEEKKGKFSTNEQMNLDYIFLNGLIANC